jgi:uncharacterized paraquat-inducible protein A
MDEQQLIAAIQSALSDIESGLRELKDLSIENAETAAYFALCYAKIASMRELVDIVQSLLPNERHPPHKYCPQCKQWRDADDTHCSKCGMRLVLKHLNESE